MQTLAVLNLNDNQIGNEGAKRLAKAIRDNTVIIIFCFMFLSHLQLITQTLKEIQLWNNTILSSMLGQLRKLDSRLKC